MWSSDPRPMWMPVWSKAAALRALRGVLVIPGLFAVTLLVIGDLQLAIFAAFGAFATLVLASFEGDRRDKLIAHAGLALTGSVLIVIGTVINGFVLIATLVTIVVAFVVLFAGVAGPNVASGSTAALVAYILPAVSPGTVDLVPSRLAGWWLAAVTGTVAVLLLSPRSPGAQLREAAADSARALARQLDAALSGDTASRYRENTLRAKQDLLSSFTRAPYRQTGLATADQALDNLVSLLEWASEVVCDSLREYRDFRGIPEVERQLFTDAAAVLRDIGVLLDGGAASLAPNRLPDDLAASADYLRRVDIDGGGYREAVHLSFHARTVAAAVHTAMADALIAAHRANPAIVAGGLRRWHGVSSPQDAPSLRERRWSALWRLIRLVSTQVSLRSTWLVNSVRGALALAAAVAIADVTSVEHGFWVVLGTLSVLRTNAVATGATVLRALWGTVIGFAIGALLLVAIGNGSVALWTTLPLAVFVASYAPGALPFAAGQAAFTVTVSVLFNLLNPVGWQIGVVRIEDVALGCAVSVVVGVLFWPRGAAAVVARDLADALRSGGAYFADAANWALGLRTKPPSAVASVTAAVRLNDALRVFLSEQGTKQVPKEQLWRLVGGTLRTRLIAHCLGALPYPPGSPQVFGAALSDQAGQVAAWYDHLAARIARADHNLDVPVLAPPRFHDPLTANPSDVDPACVLWVGEHLRHLMARLPELVEPVQAVAALRSRPWWR